MEKTAFVATIYGMVQGVGFRYFTLHRAEKYNVSGYVKNLPNGAVEAYVEGLRETLEQFLEELKKGPLGASVNKIEIQWQPQGDQYNDFRITY